MQSKDINSITLADIQAFVAEKIPEGKSIDYKSDFYRLDATNAAYAKSQYEELLKDISSFANTEGGDLIIGVEEVEGVPTNVCGFQTSDPDKLMLRISEIVQNGLEPRVNLTIRWVEHSPGLYVFVVRIPKSIIAPHRVVFRREFGQFWARNSGGAFRMDTSELRQAFTLTETANTRIRTFRKERTQVIKSGQTPVLLPGKSKLICHLIPSNSFASQVSLDPSSFQNYIVNLTLMHSSGGWSHFFNIDGMFVTDRATGLDASGYVQLFRNGVIESVADDCVFYFPQDENKTYPCWKTDYVRSILESFPNYLLTLAGLGMQTPVWCFFTLTGMKGINIYSGSTGRTGRPIDRDVLYLPEVMIDNLATTAIEQLLAPMYDTIWNAAGYRRCPQFDDNRRYIGA